MLRADGRDSQVSPAALQQPRTSACLGLPPGCNGNKKASPRGGFCVACAFNSARRPVPTPPLGAAPTSNPPSLWRWPRDKPAAPVSVARCSSRAPPGFGFRYPLPETPQFHIPLRDAGRRRILRSSLFRLLGFFAIVNCEPITALHWTHPSCCALDHIKQTVCQLILQ